MSRFPHSLAGQTNPGAARRTEPNQQPTPPKAAAEPARHGLRAPTCALRLNDPEKDLIKRRFDELTPRELDVVFALCEGGANEAIADRLCIALPTLRTHLMRLNQKLGATSKGDVIRVAADLLLDAYRTGTLRQDASEG